MSRRRVVEKRPLLPDSVYGSVLLTRFINQVMQRGKKALAEKIVYGALEIVRTRVKRDPLAVFEKALEHVKPVVEVKSRRVGGSTYQVPVEVNEHRAVALGMRWIVDDARNRSEHGMIAQLAGGIVDAADEEGGGKGKGGAVKKREDTHRMAEANKAFSHYNYKW